MRDSKKESTSGPPSLPFPLIPRLLLRPEVSAQTSPCPKAFKNFWRKPDLKLVFESWLQRGCGLVLPMDFSLPVETSASNSPLCIHISSTSRVSQLNTQPSSHAIASAELWSSFGRSEFSNALAKWSLGLYLSCFCVHPWCFLMLFCAVWINWRAVFTTFSVKWTRVVYLSAWAFKAWSLDRLQNALSVGWILLYSAGCC